jgi:hypothetical protein
MPQLLVFMVILAGGWLLTCGGFSQDRHYNPGY